MSPRDSDLAKLAGLCGWEYHSRLGGGAYFYNYTGEDIDIPAPDAPLPEALAFVGRIAETLGCKWGDIEFSAGTNVVIFRTPFNAHQFQGDAPDLAWAACRAAIAAKGGAT